MKVKVVIEVEIKKDNHAMCDSTCVYSLYGTYCDLFKISNLYEYKRVRQCMLREIMYNRKGIK